MRNQTRQMLVFLATAATAWMGATRMAVGQYYVGPYPPVQQQQQHPQSAYRRPPAGVAGAGFNPFVLNSHTGRFDYVPIPYDTEPTGPNYNPMRLNWYSGR